MKVDGFKINWWRDRWFFIMTICILTLVDIITTAYAKYLLEPLINKDSVYYLHFSEQSSIYLWGTHNFTFICLLRVFMMIIILGVMYLIYYIYISKGIDFDEYYLWRRMCPYCHTEMIPIQEYSLSYCQQCQQYHEVGAETRDINDCYFDYYTEDGRILRRIEGVLWGLMMGIGAIIILYNIKAILYMQRFVY